MTSSYRIAAQPSLRELVASKIRESIASGAFAPGQRLVERELCDLFEVSRTSVREAMREIESDGLVVNVPNKGPIVAVLSREAARSIYEVRTELEGLIVGLFTRHARPEQINDLERAVDALENAYARSTTEVLPAKSRFYDILLEGSGNPIAADMLRSIHTRVSQLRATSLSDPERAEASLSEIREMLSAIRARDDVLAQRLCEIHIGNAAKVALALLDR